VALWFDPAVHGAECRRFDSYVVKGPDPDDGDFFTGAIGKDGYGLLYLPRGQRNLRAAAPLRIGPLADGAIGAGRARAARVRHAAVREGLRHGSPAPACVRALSSIASGGTQCSSHSRRRPQSLAVSLPADRVPVCKAQGGCRPRVAQTWAIHRLSTLMDWTWHSRVVDPCGHR
jgi:hypothetical protein